MSNDYQIKYNHRSNKVLFGEFVDRAEQCSEDVKRLVCDSFWQQNVKLRAETSNMSVGDLVFIVQWIMVRGEPILEFPYALVREAGIKKDTAYQLAIDLAENVIKQYAQILQIENISENIEQWKMALEKISKGEPDQFEEMSTVEEKVEKSVKKELSVQEIQERLNNLPLETDLTKKIKGAKELLDGLNVYAMKKSQIYDTISQAEKLADNFEKSKNVLEKRAVEDELRAMIDKIVSDIKEAAAAPASAEEIQNALREIL